MYALVGQQQPGRSPEQAGRDTRIRDIVLDFVTGEQTRLWPAATDRPTSGSAGNLFYEPSAHSRRSSTTRNHDEPPASYAACDRSSNRSTTP
jgi:hypothetical protein